MKISAKSISYTILFFLATASYSQDKWIIGFGLGTSQNSEAMLGNEHYFTTTYSLSEKWAISNRFSYVQTRDHQHMSYFEPGINQSLLIQPEINWIIVKKPFVFYTSLGIAVGQEWYSSELSSIYQDDFVWGPNVGLNLDVPLGRFSLGTRISGNTLIKGNYGNAFFSVSGVLKYRLRRKPR